MAVSRCALNNPLGSQKAADASAVRAASSGRQVAEESTHGAGRELAYGASTARASAAVTSDGGERRDERPECRQRERKRKNKGVEKAMF